MDDIQLYHPRANPGLMIPRLFISPEDIGKMRPSSQRIIRTLQAPFQMLCRELQAEKSKLMIQVADGETYWKIHVLNGGRVGTCTTEQKSLVAAVQLAREKLRLNPA